MIRGQTREMRLFSAVPWMPAYGSDVLEQERPQAPPVQLMNSVVYLDPSIWGASAVFVASKTAVPDPDWIGLSGAAKPLRAVLIAELWGRIARCVRLGAEDEGAVPVSVETREYARQLLSELPPCLELPQPTVSTDGEIIFTWFRGRDRLDAILAPDHHLTWVFRIGGRIRDGDVISLDAPGRRHEFYDAVMHFYE